MKKFIYNRISLAFFLTLLATTTKAVEPQPRPDLEAEAITRQQQRDEALQKQLQPEAVVQTGLEKQLQTEFLIFILKFKFFLFCWVYIMKKIIVVFYFGFFLTACNSIQPLHEVSETIDLTKLANCEQINDSLKSTTANLNDLKKQKK